MELNAAGAPACVIVLGASNVSRGLARLTAITRRRANTALDLFVTAGHGRSYGAASRVAMRRLPSILGSGLWRALDREALTGGGGGGGAAARQSSALVTDIGNDLLYGFAAGQVAAWVRESVRRLAERGSRTVVTRLPLASLEGVGPGRYRLLRMCYVPGCRLSLTELNSAAHELDEAVAAIASEFDATLVEQPGEWYGLDAIHVRRRRLDSLWHRVCDAWGLPPVSTPVSGSLAEWAELGTKAAEVRSLARRMRFTPQPVVRRPGLTLWLH